MYLWISADCGSGSECPGMEALLEAEKAQLMPRLLSDGNFDKVEDDERMITHVDVAQDKHHYARGEVKKPIYIILLNTRRKLIRTYTRNCFYFLFHTLTESL